ncbi:MAG: methylmalonyl-CoA epimerase [Candidatus Kapabacteria bacterium]|nr:methylmalonyl-CoA epimerase [Candidatus Kapabacteria bacterium]
MISHVNHIGIAVKDLEQAIENFRKIVGFTDVHTEIVSEQKVKIASFKIGEVLIELTAPTDESSTISKFIEKRGEGIHHIAFETDSIQNDLDSVKNLGINLINEYPVFGAHEMLVAFLHPKSTNGVLVEFCQPK